MRDRSPSPKPVGSGPPEPMASRRAHQVNRPRKRELRLRFAAPRSDFAAPMRHQTPRRPRKYRESPANADVAQLVEHFTRNEGVPGSIPGVGSGWEFPPVRSFLIPGFRGRLGHLQHEKCVECMPELFGAWRLGGCPSAT